LPGITGSCELFFGSNIGFDPRLQFLPRTEGDHPTRGDRDLLAGLGIPAGTLVAAAPLLFKPRPWLPIVQCAYATFIGHLIIHNVIDNDHWRHLFLIYAILWGAIASEKMLRRGRSVAYVANRAGWTSVSATRTA
jgi:hypothetical protein